jgi:hypothetical protein
LNPITPTNYMENLAQSMCQINAAYDR